MDLVIAIINLTFTIWLIASIITLRQKIKEQKQDNEIKIRNLWNAIDKLKQENEINKRINEIEKKIKNTPE